MTATALATTPAPDDATAAQVIKPRRISRKMQQALTHLATKGVTQREAAKRAKMSETHLSRELRKPHIQVFIARKARETIGTAPLRASARLVELIDANSEHVAAQVSERILTSEGILKSDQRSIAVNVDVKAGFILDLREDQATASGAHMRHVQTIEAKPLIDNALVQGDGPATDD